MSHGANNYLQITELDFNDIRDNLKTFLSSQQQFRDYDFEGSAMSTLLDVLAYNTHYNSYYVNMLGNEMFLDTAQQRDSVVSHAKLLGYLPTSAIGASANVQLTFTGVANTTSQFTIPKNSQFVTTIDDIQYTYVTPEAYTVKNAANTFTLPITIKEGIPLTQRFTVDFANPQRYIIPNKNVDTSSISVRIQNSAADDTVVEYTKATDLETITSTSTIYFIEEAVDGRYELVFGSGSLGKALENGNIIIIDYLVNSADATNGATTFTVDDLSGITESYSSVAITLNKKSSGGHAQESVRFY
jgi:hypothetical protein